MVWSTRSGGADGRSARLLSVSRWLPAAMAFLVVSAISTGSATGIRLQDRDDNREHGRDDRAAYELGLWGDMPYSDGQAAVGLPNLIADMNRSASPSRVHDGDLKTGNGAADLRQRLYTGAPATSTRSRRRRCSRPATTTGPIAIARRTAASTRSSASPTSGSLLQHAVLARASTRCASRSRSAPLCLGVSDPSTLTTGQRALRREPPLDGRRVTYATLNIQGSCNNLCGDCPDTVRIRGAQPGRTSNGCTRPSGRGSATSAAVMFISQADPGFSESEFDAPQRDPQSARQTDGDPDGFHDFLWRCATRSSAFRKPVAYVHGDSHYFRIDKPLLTRGLDASRTSHASRPSAITPRRQHRRQVGKSNG